MSLPRDGLHPVPADTARVAHAAFPDGNIYLRLRDELGSRFDDELFTVVYAVEGQPALHPWQLALVSARYIGQRKTHLQHLFTALATNILRLVCWLEGAPFAKTRTSRFAALAAYFLQHRAQRLTSELPGFVGEGLMGFCSVNDASRSRALMTGNYCLMR